MIPTLTKAKHNAILLTTCITLAWVASLSMGAANLVAAPDHVDMNSGAATVPFWFFITSILGAMIFTATSTWKIATAFTRLAMKVEEYSRHQHPSNPHSNHHSNTSSKG